MPNCDFYGTQEDHKGILSWLFQEGTCRIFELSSEPEKPLREFFAADGILKIFTTPNLYGRIETTVYLQIYVLDAGPPFVPQRVSLDPKRCNGCTYRYSADGWGLVQLYLASPIATGLDVSHTNHNSEKRAQTWESTIPEMGTTDAWNFKKITSFSARLNREIKKRRIGKIGSRSVLPGALQVWRSGAALTPFCHGQIEVEIDQKP